MTAQPCVTHACQKKEKTAGQFIESHVRPQAKQASSDKRYSTKQRERSRIQGKSCDETRAPSLRARARGRAAHAGIRVGGNQCGARASI